MKTTRTLHLFLLAILSPVALFLLSACRHDPDAAGAEYTLDLTASVPVRSLKTDFDLSRLGRFVGPLEIDTLFRYASFSPFDGQSLLMCADNQVFRVGVPDGKILATYGRPGRGPMEYAEAGTLDRMEGEVFITDYRVGKQLVFDLEGKPLRSLELERLVMQNPIAPGKFFRGYPNGHKKGCLYEIVDEEGTVYRTSRIPPVEAKNPIVQLNGCLKMEGRNVIRPQLSYDYYTVTETEESLWIHVYTGQYAQPLEVLWDLELKRLEGDKYISREDFRVIVSGGLAFVRYFMGGLHEVIYDLKTGKILFNIKITSEEDPILGLPVEHGGKPWYVWPVYSDEHFLICSDLYDEHFWLFTKE